MQAKHTPGPWLACPPRNPKQHRHWHVRQDGGEFVCQIEATSGGQIERSEANARLIAAAPDMLEILERLTADPAAVSAAEVWEIIKRVKG